MLDRPSLSVYRGRAPGGRGATIQGWEALYPASPINGEIMPAATCTGCGVAFAGVTLFDAHHKENYDAAAPPFVDCLDPSSMGLSLDEHGRWGTAGSGDGTRGTVYVPAAERDISEFLRNCVVCDAEYERPRGRGRPPTKCPKCRG